MTVYEKVKKIADKKKISIARLEIEAGLSNGTIGGWRTSRPYAESLAKVAKILGTPIEKLLA